MERRKFLGSSALLGAFSLFSKTNNKLLKQSFNSNGNDFYFVKSGEFNNDAIIGQAVLSVPNKSSLNSKIVDLRQQFSYFSQIKYSSSDKYKIGICKALIDHFLFEFDGTIWIKVIHNGDTLLTDKNPLIKEEIRNSLLSELAIVSQAKNKIYYKLDSYFGPSLKKKYRLNAQHGIEFKPLKGKDEDVLQIADLILGLICGAIRNEAKNKVKLDLIEYLKESCETDSFIPGSNYKNKIRMI